MIAVSASKPPVKKQKSVQKETSLDETLAAVEAALKDEESDQQKLPSSAKKTDKGSKIASDVEGGSAKVAKKSSVVKECKSAGSATQDKAELEAHDSEALDPGSTGKTSQDTTGAKKKTVKLKKQVTERIRQLNAEGCLVAPLRMGAVAIPLSALSEEDALSVLDTLQIPVDEGGGEHVDDPTAWIVAAAHGAAEQAAYEEEQWAKWDEKETKRAGELVTRLPEPVIERIRSINRTVNLAEPLRLVKVAGPLSSAGEMIALKILDDLVTESEEIEFPSYWVLKAALRRAGPVMARVDRMNRGGAGRMDLLEPMDVEKVRAPLSMLKKEEALELLEKLQEKALEVEDPTTWVVEACEKRSGPLAKRLQKLNDSGELADPIKISWVLEELSKLSDTAAAHIVHQLERKPDKIRHPTSYLRGSVRHQLEKEEEEKKAAEDKKKAAEDKGKKRSNTSEAPWKKPAKTPRLDKTETESTNAKPGIKSKGKAKGAMPNAAPMTPTDDDDSAKTKSDGIKAKGATDNEAPKTPPDEENSKANPEDNGKDVEETEPVDPAEEEAAAWRALRDAFGDDEEMSKKPDGISGEVEDEWGDVDAEPQDAEIKPAMEEDGCDDGEGDDGEWGGEDDDMQ